MTMFNPFYAFTPFYSINILSEIQLVKKCGFFIVVNRGCVYYIDIIFQQTNPRQQTNIW